MIEVILSVVACMVVLLLQALVHYAIKTRPRRTMEAGLMEEGDKRAALVGQQNGKLGDGTGPYSDKPNLHCDDVIPRMMAHNSCSSFDWESAEESESSFDGDEPDIFFQLLKQTGSEMVQVRS